MNTTEITHRSILNQGAFFPPYYLFDLLGRRHADDLDPLGREANRRLLRRPFRAAYARYSSGGSTPGEAWTAWHRELFEALGFVGARPTLRRLDAPVETQRHGAAPISHAAYAADGETPLVYVDLHGFGVDPDRDRYANAGRVAGRGAITEEPIARAIELALDAGEVRWAIVGLGDRLRLYRKGGSVARQYLEIHFPALFDADRDDEWTAFWGLFRYAAFVPDPETGKCLLERILEESQRHASRIADDLRENVVLAVEALIQGVLDDPANREHLTHGTSQSTERRAPCTDEVLHTLFTESLYFLYRLLFILYAESRDLLPVAESPVYRDTYSVEHLRDMAERPLAVEDADKTYYSETLWTLFRMLHEGFPSPGAGTSPASPFTLPPFDGQLFDPARTALLRHCRIPDRAMREVIRELSLSRPRRRREHRERYSYADLGVDQLGSIYEGLLVYEPTIIAEETIVAKVKNEERLVTRAQADAYGLEAAPGPDGEPQVLRPGAFVLRLWGGRRKGSGSYYTPQEITAFLIKEALAPLVEPILQAVGRQPSAVSDQPVAGKRAALSGEDHASRAASRATPHVSPEAILELKVCDPAMGSGAFLIQACRYLAEAYAQARIAAGVAEDGRLSASDFAHIKRRVAEKCLYGVDLNPLAVELAKVSLWLETLANDRPLTFLDAHLRCGNSLIGAPLRDAEGRFTLERLSAIPDDALKEVRKEATAAQKAAARARLKRNREQTKAVTQQRAGQGLLMGVDWRDWGYVSVRAIEAALADTLTHRLALEESDEALPLRQAIALVHEKAQQFDALQHAEASRYRQAKAVCDLWCAVWFWPSPALTSFPNEGGPEEGIEPPTTQVYLELVGALLGTDTGSLTDEERAAYLGTAESVGREQRFFHWELEFPEVWREKSGKPKANGGFDAVVGNPPWETVKPNSKEFWSNYNPLFRNLDKQAALRCANELRTDPVINAMWQEYAGRIAQMGNYLKRSKEYANQGQGDINTYKLFMEKGYNLVHVDGNLGLVLPSGFYTDSGAKELRQLFFETCQVHYLLALVNERFIFPAVDHRFRFVLLGAWRHGQTESVAVLFRLNVQNAVWPENLAGVLANLDAETLRLPLDVVRRFSPDTLSLMEFNNQREVNIAAIIYADHPLLGKEVPNTWNVCFDSGLHMTNNSDLFSLEGVPIIEGKNFHQFDLSWAAPTHFIELNKLELYFSRKRSANIVLGSFQKYGMLRFRAIARSTDERTAIGTVCPPLTAYEGNAPAIFVVDVPEIDKFKVVLFLGCIYNSFVIDFLIRMRVSAKINIGTIEQIPLPRQDNGDSDFDHLVPRAARLTCTTAAFADLWNEVAVQYPDTLPAPWHPDLAARDPRTRAHLRAEIDALVADLYGLSETDFAYILTTFPLLDRDQPALPGEPKSTVTRDLALLELFRLRGSAPPQDVVAFFAEAGADVSAVTGPVRELAERVALAEQLGAVGYVPSGRGGEEENDEDAGDDEAEDDD